MYRDSEQLLEYLLGSLATFDTLDEFVKWYRANYKEMRRCYNAGIFFAYQLTGDQSKHYEKVRDLIPNKCTDFSIFPYAYYLVQQRSWGSSTNEEGDYEELEENLSVVEMLGKEIITDIYNHLYRAKPDYTGGDEVSIDIVKNKMTIENSDMFNTNCHHYFYELTLLEMKPLMTMAEPIDPSTDTKGEKE